MNSPKYSVYIPCRNYGDYVAEAIESVLRQTETDWEILIIDDGSTDHTAAAIGPYRDAPNISVHNTGGIGLPKVCNYALRHARGKYIIRLDGDDVFDENILLVLGRQLDADPQLALVFPDYYLMDGSGNVFAHERRRRLYREDHMLDLPPNGACILARRDILLELGGYREDLGAQDGVDLWTRIRETHKCGNVNLPLYFYRRHDANLTGNNSFILSARRQIKLDAAEERLKGLRPVIAVIPCRRHYDFAKDLWSEPLGTDTMLGNDIRACLGSKLIDHVVVACDNPEAEEVVRSFKDDRVHFCLRDAADTIRSVSLVPTLEKAVRPLDPQMEGIVLIRYFQTPFVSAETIDEAVTTLAMNDADSAVGVTEIKEQSLFVRDRFGLRPLYLADSYMGGQGFYSDARTCVATRSSIIARGSLVGPRVASFVISPIESFFIGDPDNLRIARMVVRSRDGGAA